jgi:hypothetical protein
VRIGAAAALLLLVVLALALVVIVANRPSFFVAGSTRERFPFWLRGPLGQLLPHFNPSEKALRYLISALIAAMFACYLVAIRFAQTLRARWTWAAIVAPSVIFVLGPPIGSADVFNYINYGHIAAVDHLNPYTTIPLHAPHTGLSFALSRWHGLRSPYGPPFTQLAELLAPLGVAASLWALKVLVCAAFLAMLLFVWRSAEKLGRNPVAAIAWVGLNPLVLVWVLGSVHYDALMMAFVVAAIYLSLCARTGSPRRSELFAGAAFAFAIALKAAAVFLTPIFLQPRRRRPFLVGLAAAGGALALSSIASFGFHGPWLGAQTNLINTHSLADVAGYLAGIGGETHGLHQVLTVTLIVAIIACGVWAWRSPEDWLTAGGTLMLVLVATLSWSVPWYILWVLPFAALSGSRWLRVATLALSIYFLISFVPAEPLLADKIGFHPEATAIGRAAGNAVRALGA